VEPARRLALSHDLARLADGDRAAIEPVFQVLWPLVRSFCRRALGSDADGDDAAQEAMIKVFARAADYDPARDAATWALAIAAWECRTVRRRAGRRREQGLAAAADRPAAGPRPDEALSARQLAAAATAVLGMLRPQDVSTILDALSDERPDRARGTDGPAPATLRKRLERALGRLRAAWRSRHGEA
jgi:RNA polymerase sigma-70 factor (ECF subfamily)